LEEQDIMKLQWEAVKMKLPLRQLSRQLLKESGYASKIYILLHLGFHLLKKSSRCSILTSALDFGWLVSLTLNSHQFFCSQVWRLPTRLLQVSAIIWCVLSSM